MSSSTRVDEDAITVLHYMYVLYGLYTPLNVSIDLPWKIEMQGVGNLP